MLRAFLAIPVEVRTDALTQLTLAIEEHSDREAIRSALREFWSHHSYVRVISEAGLPDEVFLLRELLARALRHLLPVDEVGGDLYVLMDSLNLKESDARWLGSLPDSLAAAWADVFQPSRSSVLASCKLLALRAANIALSRDLIEFSDDEIRRVHEAAVEVGVSDIEFIKSSANDRTSAHDRLPLHLR